MTPQAHSRTFSRWFLTICALVCLGTLLYAQENGPFPRARDLVARVQDNLKRAADANRDRGKERERYDNAQRHLSEFDRELSRAKFDKGKLDEAIDDVKNVVEHNTLTPEDRDALTRNLEMLREMREKFDSMRRN